MSYNTFPTFIGAAWDIKKKTVFQTSVDTSASGAEFRTARWGNLPHYEFKMKFNYLSLTDRETIEAFMVQQCGEAIPFLLSIPNDKSFTNKVVTGTVDGVNKVFQIPLPAQAKVVSGTVADNGGVAGANVVDENGLITFTTAPTSGHVITWSGYYAYLVRFKDDNLEVNQFMSRMYDVQPITFRTVR